MRVKNIHSDRISRLRDNIKEKKVDAFLVVKNENIFYLTGFTGSSGLLYVDAENSILFTDSRYSLQCEREVKDSKVVIYKEKKEIFSKLNQFKSKIIGFNSFNMLYYQKKTFSSEFKGKKLKDIGGAVEKLRRIKDSHELKVIKDAIVIADMALNETISAMRVGEREVDVKNRLESKMRMNGADKESFDTIVVSGRNSALIHGRPSSRKIKDGDLVLIDFGVKYKNYCTDMTRTFVLGEPSKKQRIIYDVVQEAKRLAISELKDGVSSSYVYNIAKEHITSIGYGDKFTHGLGHGIGIEVHEEPALTYVKDAILREGMIVTIEPGVYIEKLGGIRIEDMLYITKTGCVNLTKGQKELSIM